MSDNNTNKGQERPTMDEWRCRGCNNLLGVLDGEGEILRIKYKDFYVSILGGEVEVLCRRCALPNHMGYTDPKKNSFTKEIKKETEKT